ncbi:MAG: MFS transporter [Alphaproteobacteria bacterium]|nr:MFS transporter [Alphaproteobacteria bacterium]
MVFLEIVCLGATIPILPYYVTDTLGAPAVWVGLLMAFVTAPKIVGNPVWGGLSDRFGRKRVLMITMAGAAIGSALWAVAPSLGAVAMGGLFWLGAGRLINGLFAAQATLAFAVASDTSAAADRTASLGVLGAAFGAGLTVGMPLGGWIGSHSHAAVGWLCVGCELAAVTLIALMLRETRRHEAPEGPQRRAMRLGELIRHTSVQRLLVICIVMTAGYSVMTPTLSLLASDRYGFDEQQTGWVFFLWGMTGIVIQGGVIRPIVRRLGETATILMGLWLLAGGFVWLAAGPPAAGLWGSAVLIGIGGGFAVPALSGLISFQVCPDQQGSVHGLTQSATAIGRSAGAIAGAALYAAHATGRPYWLGAALLLATALARTSL